MRDNIRTIYPTNLSIFGLTASPDATETPTPRPARWGDGRLHRRGEVQLDGGLVRGRVGRKEICIVSCKFGRRRFGPLTPVYPVLIRDWGGSNPARSTCSGSQAAGAILKMDVRRGG
ncbi:hypothetical protein GWI33_022586 [Rhynchophorus ferrugineus]|uniref:Uncharacterized protein n=1 Tax=Rhynchophorus ferrugineus TaxID=354439 RepID=A0A834HRW2_RHYFE|nr:hypothetical protein GWI33_022588 [Rhynchophorus ferrugineus]KAF7264711.1 hypothetical protein GWI33_022586 [Rhynchophorus ferrugineus]